MIFNPITLVLEHNMNKYMSFIRKMHCYKSSLQLGKATRNFSNICLRKSPKNLMQHQLEWAKVLKYDIILTQFLLHNALTNKLARSVDLVFWKNPSTCVIYLMSTLGHSNLKHCPLDLCIHPISSLLVFLMQS